MDTDLMSIHNFEAGLNQDDPSLKVLHRLRKWNDTQVKFDETTIHRKFERYVSAQPQHPALHFNNKTETYAELDEKANIIAHHLLDNGIQKEALVGVVMKRTPELVYAMLGILKAGAAYVPIDPDYPSERIDYLLQDSQCQYVLTDGSLQQHHDIVFNGKVSSVRDIILASDKIHPVERIGKSNSLAYTIYTSGSTGRPKGAMVEHRGIINFINCYQKLFNITPDDRIIQFASISFAASVSEIFMALLTGATLYLVPKSIILHHKQFEDFLLTKNISIATLPPHYIVDLDPARNNLRLLITAGSPASWTTVEKWRKHVIYYNAYGTSETSVGISTFNTTGVDIGKGGVPIGKPNFNTRFYILDEQGRLTEPGEAGELCVSGVCVGRGYRNRPELTAEKFPQNPYEPGERMYRTGDLARWIAGGNIELLGRIDDQVKINGHRIEPDEIAAVLSQADDVEDAIVIAKKVNGDVRLCAYCVAPDLENLDSIRHYIQQKLPEYMVPSFFIKIDAIPLNINGKLDKKALPDPLMASLNRADWQPPRNPNEQLLGDIWCKVLRLEPHQLGVYDNFFHIGGDSLKAIKIISTLFSQGYLLEVADLFHNPTIATLGQLLDKAESSNSLSSISISADQLTPLEKQHVIAAINSDQKDIEILAAYPLSPMQRAMLFHYLTSYELTSHNLAFHDSTFYDVRQGATSYIVQSEFILSGKILVPQFERSLQKLMLRHDILRTLFYVNNDEQTLQLVVSRLPLNFQFHDLSEKSYEVQNEFFVQWYAADRKKLFQLEQESAIRFSLCKLAEDKFSLCITFNHIIIDGWCQHIIWGDLQHFYAEEMTAQSNLSGAIPYHHYIQWLAKQDTQKALDYWKEQLNHYDTLATIPARHSQPGAQADASNNIGHSFESTYETREFSLSAELSEQIRHLCKIHQFTLNSLFKTLWGVLLQKYNNCKDVVFGEVIAGRPAHLADADQIMGLFINTIPVRVTSTKDQQLIKLIEKVQEQTLVSQKNQYISLAEIQAESSLNQHLLDHLLVFEHFPSLNNNKDFSEFTIEPGYIAEQTNYPLNVTIIPQVDINISFLFNTQVYPSVQIEQLFKQLNYLLQQAVEHPLQYVSQLSLQAEKNYQPIIKGIEYPCPALGIHQLIETQVAKTPDAVAVIAIANMRMDLQPTLAGSKLTYQQLNQQANKLAYYLTAKGVSAGERVAILLERSPEFIISLLAVLKTGAAYVPMDCNYPAARLQRIMDVAKPCVVITRDHLQKNIADASSALINLDYCWAIIQQQEEMNLPNPAGLQAAQILFTSGTTGQPKGVVVTHQGLVNHALFIKQKLQLTQDDCVLQFAALGFDAHSEEIFPALLSGARIALRPADLLQSFERLADIIQQQKISILDLPTAYWNHWVDELDAGNQHTPAAIASVRGVIIGGESISVKHVKIWQTINPQIPLVNSYGPTEATVICSWYQVPRLLSNTEYIPIGHPLHNTEFYILDMDQQPVAADQVGELYIAGAGVARGYFNAEALTDEKFITPVWAKNSGKRLYKTGDLVRFNSAEQQLFYVGRVDNQIKLRGVRIELDEIKNALLNNPAIHQALVTTEIINTHTEIVAYVQQVSAVSTTDIKNLLKDLLPQQMIPNHIISVDQWPLNTNGKVDLQKLRSNVEAHRTSSPMIDTQQQPHTQLQQQLCAIWELVLGHDVADIHANFFEIGGHSLKAISLLGKINRELHLHLPTSTLLLYPTIASMADYIEMDNQENNRSGLIRLSKHHDLHSPTFYFVHPVGGSVFCYQQLVNNLSADWNIFGIQAAGLDQREPEFLSLKKMAAGYVEDILKQQPQGKYYLGGWSMGGQLAQEMAVQLKARGYDVELLVLIDTWHPSINPAVSSDKLLHGFISDFISTSANKNSITDITHITAHKNSIAEIYPLLIERQLITADFGLAHLQVLFSVYKNNQLAMSQHQPERYDGNTLLFVADTLLDSTDKIVHGLGWKTVMENMRITALDGNHYNVFSRQNSHNIASDIQHAVSASQADLLPEI